MRRSTAPAALLPGSAPSQLSLQEAAGFTSRKLAHRRVSGRVAAGLVRPLLDRRNAMFHVKQGDDCSPVANRHWPLSLRLIFPSTSSAWPPPPFQHSIRATLPRCRWPARHRHVGLTVDDYERGLTRVAARLGNWVLAVQENDTGGKLADVERRGHRRPRVLGASRKPAWSTNSEHLTAADALKVDWLVSQRPEQIC